MVKKKRILVIAASIILLLSMIAVFIWKFNLYKTLPNGSNLSSNAQIIEPSTTPTISASPTPSPTITPTSIATITPVPTPTPKQEEPLTNWWDYPSEILPVTKDPNNPLVLVSKKYQLPSSYEPADLTDTVSTGITGGSATLRLRSVILTDLTELGNAAKSANISIGIQSAYRSYSNQVDTYNYWLGQNGGDVSSTDQISARPGHSQHQLGTGLDFNSYEGGYLRLWQDFNTTNAAAWLKENAWHYGFIMSYPEGRESETGYAYEAWHFRWVGKTNAREWYESGLVLDKWLETK
jgi:LAS superfamily LD-carboxypeptidase LdcB